MTPPRRAFAPGPARRDVLFPGAGKIPVARLKGSVIRRTSPRVAGRAKQNHSRDAFRARVLRPPLRHFLKDSPPAIKRGAERRKAHPANVRACFGARQRPLTFTLARLREREGGAARLPALRSGTRHASRNQHWLSSRPALPETRLDGRYPLAPVSSLPSTSETGRSAGRSGTQSRPGAGLRSPPAGTALAPPSVRHR